MLVTFFQGVFDYLLVFRFMLFWGKNFKASFNTASFSFISIATSDYVEFVSEACMLNNPCTECCIVSELFHKVGFFLNVCQMFCKLFCFPISVTEPHGKPHELVSQAMGLPSRTLRSGPCSGFCPPLSLSDLWSANRF